MFAVPGMLLDGSACPCEPAAACWANGIFRENLGQSVRELTIKCRNVGVRTHDVLQLEIRPLMSARPGAATELPRIGGVKVPK